jgi:hypothetical protein
MNPKYYKHHDMVYDGVDSMSGLHMYHCKKCGRTDTQIYWAYWQLEKQLAELDKLLAIVECKELNE